MTIEVESTEHGNLPGDGIEAVCKEKAIDENLINRKTDEGDLRPIDDVPISEATPVSSPAGDEEEAVVVQVDQKELAKQEAPLSSSRFHSAEMFTLALVLAGRE